MLNNITCAGSRPAANVYNEAEAIALLLCKECVAGLNKLQLPQEVEALVDLYVKAHEDIFDCEAVNNLTALVNGRLVSIVLVGCGEGSDCKPNNFRKAAGAAARALQKLAVTKAAVAAPILLNNKRSHYLQAVGEGLYLGAYSFTEFKEPKKAKPMTITIVHECEEKALTDAAIISQAVSYARTMVNRPGNVVYPEVMAKEAEAVAKELNLELEVLDEEAMAAKGMAALLAVGQGSVHKPRLITLTYKGAGEAPFIAYVGKGITFDSGGISIKPDDNMGEMKDDMAGAAAVLGAIKAIAALKLPVNVLAVLACAENMPGGNAQRPGDIVKAANGKTIEVISTDAEGRMVLADAVWYACRKGAAKVIDIATLTGAVIVALGKETSGIISNDEALVQALMGAGKRCGEGWWQLPSLPECKEALKSDVADLLNSAGRAGGCITGGLFIGEFVDKGLPWAHLDIGGTSTSDKVAGHIVKGGTGFGTMTLIRLAGDL